jgi:hypothetical protein
MTVVQGRLGYRQVFPAFIPTMEIDNGEDS